MSRLVVILGLLLAAGPRAAAGLVVSLKLAEPADERSLPYASAELTIDDSDGSISSVIRAVAVRVAEGGPTFLYPLAMAPGTKQSLRVSLPVISGSQKVSVRLLDADEEGAAVLASPDAIIDLPAALVQKAQPMLVDGAAYGAWKEQRLLPAWPNALRRNLLLTLIIAAVIAASMLFVRRASLRLVGLGVVVAASSAAIALQISSADVISVGEFSFERKDVTPAVGETMLAAACLRTAQWNYPGGDLLAVYPSPEDMSADTMTVHPTRGMTLTLRPDRVRLFRRP